METPEAGAWLDYTIMELGNWVHLFVKRAQLRGYTQSEKRAEDLRKARAYWRLIGYHLDAMERGARKTNETEELEQPPSGKRDIIERVLPKPPPNPPIRPPRRVDPITLS